MYFPERAAVVMLQQRSYANQAMEEYFDAPPTKKSEAMANKEFIAHLARHYGRAVERGEAFFVEAIGKEARVGSILDIGCGMAWADLSLYKALEVKPMLYLLDGSPAAVDDDELRVAKAGYLEDYEFSSDILATSQVLTGNGVKQEHINFVAPASEGIANLRSIDLVISLTSWFWHYPRQKYWDAVESVLHAESILMVDIAGCRPDDMDFLKSKFREVRVEREFDDCSRLRVVARGLAKMSSLSRERGDLG
jgi:hypothetical protein